jgi:periplasmic protein TonB
MKTTKVKGLMIMLLFVASSVVALGQKCAIKQDSIAKRTIYIMADKMPTFQGGLDSLKSKIKKHLKWPGQCCVEGTVYVSFIVEKDGRVTNKKVKRGISAQEHCNADGQALKVVDYLTEWTIGECNGEKVAVEVTLPIKYSLM